MSSAYPDDWINPATATRIANNAVRDAVLSAIVALVLAQMKAANATATVTLSLAPILISINATVQKVANDMGIAVTHPVTGVVVQPTASVVA